MTFLPLNLDVDQIVREYEGENHEVEQPQELLDNEASQEPGQLGNSPSGIRSRVGSSSTRLGIPTAAADQSVEQTVVDKEEPKEADNPEKPIFPIFGNFTLEKIIETIDGAGSYQRMLVMCSMLCMFGSSFVSFCISFLAAEPLFKCEKADTPGTFVPCSERIACQEPNPNVYFRYNGWTESMHLYCDQKIARESGKVLCLLVNSLTCFFCLNLSDVYGRKRMIMVNTVCVITALLISYSLNEYHIKMMFVGLAFGCEGSFSSLYLFLINEVSSPSSKLKSRISGYTLASFSVGIMCLNLLSFGFKTADRLILAIAASLSIILYPNLVNLRESPTWLIKQNRIEEAVEKFKKISVFNGRQLSDLYFSEMTTALNELQAVQAEESKNSGKRLTKLRFTDRVRLLFSDPNYRKPLLILSMISSSLFCTYYGMTTSIQDMGLEPIQLNGLFVGFTQATGFIIVLQFLARTKRKHALIIIQSNLIFCSFLLVTLTFYEEYWASRFIQGIISTIVMSATVSAMFSFLFVTNAETFPTQFRGLAVGLILLIGKLLGSLAPFINLLSKHMKVHVMVGSTFPVFLSLIATMFLKETLEPSMAKRTRCRSLSKMKM
jgi:MFS family permease